MSSTIESGQPRVAVLIPCFNDGPTLVETIDSVNEREAVELVVINDGSTDEHTVDTLAEVESKGIRVIHHEENMGLPEARNTGLKGTKARYVYPLDSDDLAVAGSLSKMADALDRNPTAAACYGDWIEFGSRERICRVPRQFDPYLVAHRNRYPVSSMFRRTVLEEVGGWTSVGNMVGYEDWNLWMSLAEEEKPVLFVENAIAVRYRIHGVRMLRKAAENHQALYETLRRTHPRLFAELGEHRRRSALSWPRRLLYPVLYGSRQPSGINRSLRTAIDHITHTARSRLER